MRKQPSRRPRAGTPRTRQKPGRANKRGEWLSDLVTYGKECTAERAWTHAKNLAGLYDGLLDALIADKPTRVRHLYPDHAVKVPRWVLDGLLSYLEQTAAGFQLAHAGRHTYWAERYRQDMVDCARFEAVNTLVCNHGVPWTEAYAEAAKRLDGLAGGEPGTIEASYKRVRRAFRQHAYGRYYRSTHLKIRDLP
jgi:hypothetical protein